MVEDLAEGHGRAHQRHQLSSSSTVILRESAGIILPFVILRESAAPSSSCAKAQDPFFFDPATPEAGSCGRAAG
jgi:hypothetical protein